MTKRREFIKLSALAAVGTLGAGSSLQAFQGGKEKLNVAVVGTGNRGTGIINILNEVPHIQVVAVSDVIPFRLDKAVSISGAKGYLDYRALLEHKGLDAVIIAVPFGLHDEVCLDALDAGKHIYCEKTLVKGIAETQKVLDAYKATNNLVFQTGHQYNSSDLYQKVEKIIQSGYLGDITGFVCQWNRNGDWRRPVPDPKWERMINWRMYKEYSGGMTAELCSHQIDFINRVLKEMPAKISGFGGIDHWKDGRETYDNIHLQFQYPSGVDASFTCTTTNSFNGYQVKVLGRKGTIDLGISRAQIFLENNQRKTTIVDGVSGATAQAWQAGKGAPIDANNDDSTLQALEQFYRSIVEGEKVYADIMSGAQTSKCVQMSLDALYEEKITRWSEYPELTL
ncbi:MAG: Gfo/Idh/MocA family oxidoreductase [Cyclobacteriaceae bacterium]